MKGAKYKLSLLTAFSSIMCCFVLLYHRKPKEELVFLQATMHSRVWHSSFLMSYCFVHISQVWIGYFFHQQLGQASANALSPRAAPVTRQSWAASSPDVYNNSLLHPLWPLFQHWSVLRLTKHQKHRNKTQRNESVLISDPGMHVPKTGSEKSNLSTNQVHKMLMRLSKPCDVGLTCKSDDEGCLVQQDLCLEPCWGKHNKPSTVGWFIALPNSDVEQTFSFKEMSWRLWL